jgi:ComF family protein
MKLFNLITDFVSLLYPRLCLACGNSLFKHEVTLCTHCLFELPLTNFHKSTDNQLDKVFWGRVPVFRTAALFYFVKGGKVQHLIHQLKYKGMKEAGIYPGMLLGKELIKEKDFSDIDFIIPVPLHPKKLRKRGYNQSEMFADGISLSTGFAVNTDVFIRTVATETQTRKSRFARFENVKEIFKVTKPELLTNRHILLVDDVITTGSTLESCVNILLEIPGIRISIASIAYAVQ